MVITFHTVGYKDLIMETLVKTLSERYNHFQNLMRLAEPLFVLTLEKVITEWICQKSIKLIVKKPKEEDEIKRYDAFFEVLNKLPDMLDEEVLKFRGVEADDLIANLVMKCEPQLDYDHIWIVSSDRDLYQLISEKTSIFNIFGRREITHTTLQEEMEISPDLYLLSRIIEGDKSDNILGVEGIGPKRAQALAKQYKSFDSLLEALPIKGRAKYIQNLNASKDLLIRNEKNDKS